MTSPSLTIHRGSHQIGGSCVELRAGGSRLILDVGMPLDAAPPKGASGPELLELGVLPRVDGLYAWQEPSVAGVIVSHGHQDHYGLVNHVHPDIPVYLGEGTKKLIEVTSLFTPSKIALKRPVVFLWPGEFHVGGFRVVPHLVDHSAFGAFAFEIAFGGRRVFYTGDFRGHGYLGEATLDIIRDRCRPGVDAVLMEGTMFGREAEDVATEQDLADAAKNVFAAAQKAVLVYQSGQNVSRAVTFYKAAHATRREFVLDFYTAHVLTELGKCRGGEKLPYPGNLHDDIRVWFPHFLTQRADREGYFEIPSTYAKWKMTKEQMADRLDEIVLLVRPGMEGDLERIPGIAGSTLIYSLWSGYRESPGTKRFLNACRDLGIDEQPLHTSGHATASAMKKLLDALQPKTIIPIHTEHPERYEKLGWNVRALADGEESAL